jgi:solute carrier family 35 protein F5
LGDVFSLLSAVFYAIYATYLKKMIPPEKESEFKFTYFLGFVGLINIFVLLPLFPIFNATGIEVFSWPNKQTLLFLTLNAFIGTFISDYFWARSVVLLGPLITTLGISLTIPLSLVSSSFFDNL